MDKHPVNPLANPDNWERVYAECRDEHLWAYIGPEPQPWKLLEEAERTRHSSATEGR
jgi:hypothetical protein